MKVKCRSQRASRHWRQTLLGALSVCLLPGFSSAQEIDPLERMRLKIEAALESQVEPNARVVLEGLSHNVERLSRFGAAREQRAFRSNIDALAEGALKLRFEALGATELAFLSEVNRDFEVKVAYLSVGFVMSEVGRDDAPLIGLEHGAAANTVFATYEDHSIRGWDSTTGLETWSYRPRKGSSPIGFAGDEDKEWLVTSHREVTPRGPMNSIVFTAPKSGVESHRFPIGGRGMLSDAVFSEDGTLGAFGLDDGSVSVWDIGHTKLVSDFRVPSVAGDLILEFSPSRSTIASATMNGRLSLFDIATGGEIWTTAAQQAPVMTFSPNGSNLYVCGERGWLGSFDSSTGELRAQSRFMDTDWKTLAASPGAGWSVAAGAFGLDQGRVHLFNESGTEAYDFVVDSPVFSTAFDAASDILYTGHLDGSLRRWFLSWLESDSSDPGTEITAVTWRDGREETGFPVWYVSVALLGDPEAYQRFSSLSTSTQWMPAGRFYLWAGERDRNDHKVEVEIRTRQGPRQLDLEVER